MGGFSQDSIGDATTLDINALTEKTNPVEADVFVIEDSEDSFNAKKVQMEYFKKLIYVSQSLNS